MTTDFIPATGLSSAHAQTIWSPLFRSYEQLPRTRERLQLKDGDFLDLDWCGDNQSSPLIVLLHGLTGCSRSKYLLGVQKELLAIGWQSVAVNLRGCSGEPNQLPRGYHSGDSDELRNLLALLKTRYPERLLAAVGFSLGGNILLKYQGEEGSDSLLSSAVAISVPFRLDICAQRMNFGFSRIYRNRFIKELYGQINEKVSLFTQQGLSDHAELLNSLLKKGRARTFEEFDHWITAPLHGFKSGTEYYEQSSSRYYLSTIKQPTLIIHSRDDPFMTEDVIPSSRELSSDVKLEITEHGGHVGFICGSAARPVYWLEQKICHWLQKI
ncbi:hydrolase [Endozoicomonas sp. OPT23]|uniref:hydrolase n=1 Tax=Endozoicomonas sp. OPT23 TaxID=2072845 RepID=UPI001D8B78CF|nr:hydrolase [Endozoicomonas sp. OPT23]